MVVGGETVSRGRPYFSPLTRFADLSRLLNHSISLDRQAIVEVANQLGLLCRNFHSFTSPIVWIQVMQSNQSTCMKMIFWHAWAYAAHAMEFNVDMKDEWIRSWQSGRDGHVL